ncbi:TatD family hydrolase [Rummeliibacillus suwonensis]|uniref:TatD family hydrolase n=1 Tax=Rummeliibacillus suwonensis TaxID=1306154 RepID=UPI0028A14F20|nr:TatD family hydrolase [Rummeliibacillus suwonensis]
MQSFIDIGLNLTDKQFTTDRAEVVERAIQNNVGQMIVTGSNVKGSREGLQIAKQYPHILFSTAGIHPHNASEFHQGSINELRQLAKQKEVVAIGECGLDFNRMFSPQTIQEQCFEAQLDLAKKMDMPLFLHVRDAHARFVDMMKNHQDQIEKSVVHCFTGDKTEVKELIEMGFYIGITGWICDERRGKELQEAVQYIPLDRLMVETDAPYLIPRTLQPKPKHRRNEPANLPHIVTEIAKYMGVSPEEVAKHSTENAKQFFRLG